MKSSHKILVVISILLCLCYLFTSCSCEYYQKRIEHKCGKLVNDTLLIHDTTYTKEIKRDTIFKYFQRDSVIVREGKLVMKYFYNSHDSTVFLQGKCLSDTVYKVIKAPYEKTEVKIDYFPSWLKWVTIILVVGLLVLAIIKKFT